MQWLRKAKTARRIGMEQRGVEKSPGLQVGRTDERVLRQSCLLWLRGSVAPWLRGSVKSRQGQAGGLVGQAQV